KTFIGAVLPRLARFDQNRFQLFIHSPLQQLRADELRAVVHAQWELVSHKQQVHSLDYDILRGVLPMTDRVQHTSYGSWMAIDIAKDFNVVMVETADGHTRCFRMANSGQDHERIVELAHSLPQPCRIGFEATGNYHRT